MDNKTRDAKGLILNAHIDDVYVSRCTDDKEQMEFSVLITQDEKQHMLPPYPVAEIDRFRVGKVDPRYVALDEESKATDIRIQAMLKGLISEKLRQGKCAHLLCRTGWQQLPNDKYIFVVGQHIVGETGDVDYVLAQTLPQLKITDNFPEITNHQLLEKYFRKIRRDPTVLIPLSAQMIRALMASVFEQEGYPLRFVLYLTGIQGSGKTTAVNDFALPMTDISNNIPAPASRALGSKPAVRDFTAGYRDMPVLIDDVCTSSGSETKRISTEVAAYTLRFVSDRIPELRKLPGGGQRSIRCDAGVIITGEFPLSASSDLTRCVIIDVDHQMYGREEDDHTVTCAVISRFLQYVSENYEACRKKIGDALGPFRADKGTDSAPRQQQHLAELSCAFQILLEFAYEIGAIGTDDLEEWCSQLKAALEHSLGVNNGLVHEYNLRNVTNISKIIIDSIENDSMRIAKNRSKLECDSDKFDGFVDRKKGQIYLRLTSLSQLLTALSGRAWTEQAVGTLLRENGLVEVGRENHTAKAKLPGIGRFVPLNRDQLHRQAEVRK